VTEAQLQLAAEQLLEACRVRGLIVDYYHRPDRAAGHRERAGLPDLIIAIDRGRIGVIELKSEKGKTTPAQDRWLACFPLAAVCRSLPEIRQALAGFGVDTAGISEHEDYHYRFGWKP
jgi:hypothetical protein